MEQVSMQTVKRIVIFSLFVSLLSFLIGYKMGVQDERTTPSNVWMYRYSTDEKLWEMYHGDRWKPLSYEITLVPHGKKSLQLPQ